MRKVLILLLCLFPSLSWGQSRTIVPGDVGIQTPFAAVGNLLVSGPTVLKLKDSTAFGTNGGLALSGGSTPAYNNCYWNDVDLCTTENVRLRERVFIGNSVLANDNRTNCCSSTWTAGLDVNDQWQVRDAQLAVLTDRGAVAITGMSKSSQSDPLGSSTSPIGVSAFVLNDTTLSGKNAWGMYSEITHNPSINTIASFGMEIDTRNASAVNQAGDPYQLGAGAINLWLAAGAGSGAINPSAAALVLTANGQTFNRGIVIKDGSLTKDSASNSQAILLGSLAAIEWYTALNTPAGILTSNAAGTFVLGGADAAAPVAQNINVQGVLTGTSNTVGADFTLNGSVSTGSANGGNINFKTSSAGGAGATQNATQQRFCVSGPGKTIVGAACTNRPLSNGVAQPIFEAVNASSTLGNSAIAAIQYQSSSSIPASFYLAFSKSNTLGTQSAVTTGDQLGRLVADGSDGSTFQDSALIRFDVDAAVSGGIVPGRIVFSTAAAGGAMTEAFRVTSGQQIQYTAVTTGTPVASLCIDASNNIIKKTTTGPCI